MKTLYIIRHAKSSWDYDLDDHDRPLAQRGLNDAPMMGKYLKDRILKPDLVISSTATRAKTTALLFLKALNLPEEELELNSKLYDFAGHKVREVVQGVGDEVAVLMIFGHNHALTNLVNLWGDKKIDNVSTAAFTAIEFDADSWSAIAQGRTVEYIKPKHIK